jgi:hypothetical protein
MKNNYFLKSAILLFLISSFLTTAQVGIGTTSPTKTLHVVGTMRVTNTTDVTTTTKMLGSDASGNFNDITAGENISLLNNVLSANAGKYGIANIAINVPSPNTPFDNMELNVGGSNINNTIFRLNSSSNSSFSISGIKGGTDGRHIILYNTSTGNMSIDNLSNSSDAINRFDTLGSSTATSGIGTVELVYDAVTQKWLVIAIRN